MGRFVAIALSFFALASCTERGPVADKSGALGPMTSSALGVSAPRPEAVTARLIGPEWPRHPEPFGDDDFCELLLENHEPSVRFAFAFTGEAADDEEPCGIVFAAPEGGAGGATQLAIVAYVPTSVVARPVVTTATGRWIGEALPTGADPRETVYELPPSLDGMTIETVTIEVPRGQPAGETLFRQIAFLRGDATQ